jgi:hypothetical protein
VLSIRSTREREEGGRLTREQVAELAQRENVGTEIGIFMLMIWG